MTSLIDDTAGDSFDFNNLFTMCDAITEYLHNKNYEVISFVEDTRYIGVMVFESGIVIKIDRLNAYNSLMFSNRRKDLFLNLLLTPNSENKKAFCDALVSNSKTYNPRLKEGAI